MELLNKFGIEESNCNSTQSVKLKKLLNVKIKTNKQKKLDMRLLLFSC